MRWRGRIWRRSSANSTVVVIEFPSMEHARGFYRSEEYAAIKTLRDGAGFAKFVLVDGYSTEQWRTAAAESAVAVIGGA